MVQAGHDSPCSLECAGGASGRVCGLSMPIVLKWGRSIDSVVHL